MKKVLTSLMVVLSLTVATAYAHPVGQKVIDKGGSGPYSAVAISESSLPDFTIYRPSNLAEAVEAEGPLPVIVFANGGCINTSAPYERFLSEVASHGYVIVAIGPFMGGTYAGMLPYLATVPESYKMFQALDWVSAQATDRKSEYYGLIDVNNIASMGHSCGGAQALYVSCDPRIKSVVMLNSGIGGRGMANASQAHIKALHCPIVFIIGGPDDIAYRNAQADFESIQTVPVAQMNLPVGHNATYENEFGGEFSKMATAWLDYVFKGDAKGEKLFKNGDVTGFDGWSAASKNFTGELVPVVK